MKYLFTFPIFFMLILPPLSAQQDTLRRFSIVVSGGMSLFTENNKEERQNLVDAGMDETTLEGFYREMALGYHLNATVFLHVSRHLAFTAGYRFFSHQANCNSTFDPQDGIHLYWGKLSEKIYVNYAGGGLYFTNLLRSENVQVNMGFNAGIAFYRNEIFQVWSPYLMTGKAFAFGPSVLISLPVTERISVTAEGSWMISQMKHLELKSGSSSETIDLNSGYYEDMGNISLGAGLKLSL